MSPNKAVNKAIPFFIHSTFRNFMGNQVKPHGLEWGLDGDAHMTYVPACLADDHHWSSKNHNDNNKNKNLLLPDHHHLDAPESRRGIVEAYNRWAFAKELEFKTSQEILELTLHNDGKHIQVQWKETNDSPTYTSTAHDDMEEMLKNDPAVKQGGHAAEVWINGVYEGTLNGEMLLLDTEYSRCAKPINASCSELLLEVKLPSDIVRACVSHANDCGMLVTSSASIVHALVWVY